MPDDGDLLTLDRRVRWLSRAGLIPLVNGSVFLLAAGPLWADDDAPLAVRVGFPLAGGAAFAIGVLLVFGRWETVVDRRRRTVVRRWRLLGWRRERLFPFGEPARVELRRESVGGGEDAATHYPVTLHGGGEPIPLVRPQDRELPARAAADRVAAFLGVELHDRTGEADGDEAVVRRPGEIGVPVGRRVREGTEPLDLPAPPAGLRTVIERDGDGLALTLPRQGFGGPIALLGLILLVPAVTVGGMGAWFALHAADAFDSPAAGVCFLIPFLAVCGFLASVPAGAALARVRVRVSPAEVRVKFVLTEAVIPAGRLEEVRVEGRGGHGTTPCLVMLRSDERLVRFGNGLGRTECEYLAAVLKATVAEDAAGGSPAGHEVPH